MPELYSIFLQDGYMHICQHFTKTNLLRLINYLSSPIKTDGHLETGEDAVILCAQLWDGEKIFHFPKHTVNLV